MASKQTRRRGKAKGPRVDARVVAQAQQSTSTKPLLSWMRRWEVLAVLSAIAVFGAALVLLNVLLTSGLSPWARNVALVARKYLLFVSGLLALVAMVLSRVRPQFVLSPRATFVFAVSGVLVLLAGHIVDPLPRVSTSDFKRLVLFNQGTDRTRVPSDISDIVKAIELSEKDPLRLAQSRLAQEHLDEALRLFDQGFARQYDTEVVLADAHAGKALVLRRLGRLTEALPEAARSLSIRPSVAAHLLMSSIQRRLGQLTEAKDSCRRALEMEPSSALAHGELGAVLLLEGMKAFGRVPILFEEAVAELDIAIKGVPDNPSLWNNKATALHRLRRDPEALTAVNESLRLKADFEDALLNKGTILKSLGRLDDAMSVYVQLTKMNPNDAEAWNNLGDGHEMKGQLAEALDRYNAAVRIDPRYETAFFNKGSVLNKLRRFPEARDALLVAVELDPKDGEAWRELSKAWMGIGDAAQARSAIAKSLGIDPKDEQTLQLKAELSKSR